METLPTISEVVINGFSGVLPQLLPVAAAGLGITALVWGIPKAVGFFKRSAK